MFHEMIFVIIGPKSAQQIHCHSQMAAATCDTMWKQIGAALIPSLCLVSAGFGGDQSDRPMWKIALAWNCHFIQEFRCSSVLHKIAI
jgi:hypothetical protein